MLPLSHTGNDPTEDISPPHHNPIITNVSTMYGIGLTILQGYWALRLGLVSVKFLSHLVSGSFYDKSHGDRSPDEPFGWLEFRKR